MQDTTNQVISEALGLFPTGRYLMTAAYEGVRSGMLVSSVQRCSDDYSIICVAAKKGHKIDPLIRDSRSFAIGIVDPNDKLVLRRFRTTDAAPTENGKAVVDDPFDAIASRKLVTGAPILTRCTTWFDCEVMRRIDLEAETELFVGLIVSILHKGEQVKIDRVVDNGD